MDDVMAEDRTSEDLGWPWRFVCEEFCDLLADIEVLRRDSAIDQEGPVDVAAVGEFIASE
jgi:hypothetical protein